MTSSQPARRSRRLELLWGRSQLAALHHGFAAFARLRRLRISTPHGDLSIMVRPGRNARALPLVCLHGFGGDKETWLLLAASLGRERGMVLIDLPGHGGSSLPVQPVTIGFHAAAVWRVLDQIGISSAILCGNSMGGGVALRMAADQPQRVAALILVASVGSDVHQHAAVAAWRAGPNPLIPEEHEVDDFIATAFDAPTLIPRSVIRYVAITRARAAVKLRRLFDDFATGQGAEGVPGELQSITMPALVIHGDRDQIVDRATATQLSQRLPQAELHAMDRVGHAPQIEAPRRTAGLITDFLRRISM